DLRPPRPIRRRCPRRHQEVARGRDQARARGHARVSRCHRRRAIPPFLHGPRLHWPRRGPLPGDQRAVP
ncbi:unnamed protein product, partial [Ectocarpus fasciculatus]